MLWSDTTSARIRFPGRAISVSGLLSNSWIICACSWALSLSVISEVIRRLEDVQDATLLLGR